MSFSTELQFAVGFQVQVFCYAPTAELASDEGKSVDQAPYTCVMKLDDQRSM